MISVKPLFLRNVFHRKSVTGFWNIWNNSARKLNIHLQSFCWKNCTSSKGRNLNLWFLTQMHPSDMFVHTYIKTDNIFSNYKGYLKTLLRCEKAHRVCRWNASNEHGTVLIYIKYCASCWRCIYQGNPFIWRRTTHCHCSWGCKSKQVKTIYGDKNKIGSSSRF